MKKIIFILVAILMVSGIMISHYYFSDYIKRVNNYSWVIEYNWDVKLPTDYTNAFDFNDESFQGEGVRYHILEYNSEVELNNCLEWTQNVDPTIIDLANSTIRSKNIDDKYVLKRDCSYKLFRKTRDDAYTLYIFFDEDLNTIYILEDIF